MPGSAHVKSETKDGNFPYIREAGRDLPRHGMLELLGCSGIIYPNYITKREPNSRHTRGTKNNYWIKISDPRVHLFREKEQESFYLSADFYLSAGASSC